MELLNITKAFHKRLATITPSLATAYESVSFEPVQGTPYQIVQLVPTSPANPTLGGSHYREQGTFQIFLCYPANAGTFPVLERAELTRSYFQRGTTLVEGTSIINILQTPKIAGTSISQDRIIVPVIIQYSVEVF